MPLKVWVRVHPSYILILSTVGGIPTTPSDYSVLSSVQKPSFLLWMYLNICISTTNHRSYPLEILDRSASIVYPNPINFGWHCHYSF
jgi:hypothetical protein